MFDLPSAKRIRRDEVQSPASSRSSSPAPNDSDVQDAHARLGKLLGLDALIGSESTRNLDHEPAQPSQSNENAEDEQEFEFRLFNAPAISKPDDTPKLTKASASKSTSAKKIEPPETETINGGTHTLRIRLHSPTPLSTNPSEGRFVKAFRGWQYYFTSPSLFDLQRGHAGLENEDNGAPEKRRQFDTVAVSGEHMLTWAKSQAWPGCDLPWRVIRLKRHQTKLPPASKDVPIYVIEGEPLLKNPKSRKKPGKKRRVQLRKRATAAQVAKETDAEKRNRKNREKKIKRRQKAREQKAAAAVGVGRERSEDATRADVNGNDASLQDSD